MVEYNRQLNSNDLNSTINLVCDECGIEANRLTCLKKHGQEPKKIKFDCSTYHKGKCDFCGKTRYVTEVRDYFYPDFNLLKT